MERNQVISRNNDSIIGTFNYDIDLLKIHDYFNILSLPIIFINNWIELLFGQIFGFDLVFYLFLVYISVDLIWLILKPKAVGSPSTILLHHVISLLGWMIPLYDNNLMLITRLALLVEFNTWFNILKRYYKYDFIYNSFYVTWFIFRVLLYPILLYMSLNGFYTYYFIKGTIFNWSFPVLLICLTLTFLNYKWSYQLIVKKGYLGVTSKRD